MSRGFWFVAGAGAGVYAMLRARRAAEAVSVDGLQDRLNGAEVGLRMFRDEVAQGRHERETELRRRYGLVPDGRAQLEGGRHRAADGQHDPERAVTSRSTTEDTTQDEEGSH